MNVMFAKRVVMGFCLSFSVIFNFISESGSVFAEEPLVVKIRPFREKNIDYTKEYKYQLLELVLNKTVSKDGSFRIEVAGEETIAQSRVIELIDRGDLTLITVMTSKEREEKLLPVRIPVYKGLWGHRIFIINRKDLNKFAAIQTEKELKALWAGQGHDWPDTQILKANGYNVVTSPNYSGLFAMLNKGRFDYFPRAVNEPWREVEVEKARDVVVEPTLLIQYHAPAYFFVSKQNKALAERLKRGFEAVIRDGSFDRLFNSHWYIQDTLKLANIQKRRIFRLKNPLLTAQTPLDRPELWFQP
ncbi:hypothetical protein QUF75_16850 [Desulfococcaceae bacterium HSG7]|nr:hypothetical protein [Desulfococcaceae bacterium HSG7]